ncbi:hypothetical protein [Sporomusa termitida]|uniref:Uncharacterized protein n=1 Tax=Sporomusa termitida TaxID=2377 RepID=A0A517DS73_9FIRM|nr:hypothetical protein [Sporomusa termitida]QDR80212.1 hypothetical protein SPTER_15310 [Sporomusa termitida]
MDKIEIGFTQFMDFILKGSTARVSYVRSLKAQPEYHPGLDFWKLLRDEIKNIHQNNLDISTLAEILDGLHEKKINQYTQAISAYQKFCKGKSIEWFDIDRSFWAFDRLVVRSTPEMGLIINGVPFVIKMYFKEHKETLTKRKANSLLTLMEDSAYLTPYPKATHAVLSIKKGKMYPLETKVTTDMRLGLEGEAMSFMHLWDKV